MTKPWIRLPRALLSGFFFFFYGIFALPFALLLPVLPRRAGRWIVRIFYRLFVLLSRVTGLYAVRCADRPDLLPDRRPPAVTEPPPPPGRIIVMNHVSLIDICVLLAHLPDAVCIAKAATKRNPFLAMVVRKLFIANDKGGLATIAEAQAHLARGVHVVVFPQGTRGGRTIRRGAARMALATRAEIEVYRIDYDPVVLAKGQPWWDVGDKIIRIALTRRGRIVPEGPNDHRAAVALTARIAAAIA